MHTPYSIVSYFVQHRPQDALVWEELALPPSGAQAHTNLLCAAATAAHIQTLGRAGQSVGTHLANVGRR